MTETDIECEHTKVTLRARGVNRSQKIITFAHLNSTKSALVALILYLRHLRCVIFTLQSVVQLHFNDFFHIAFDYTISL